MLLNYCCLNLKHIVRNKTKAMTEQINTRIGYQPIKINSPTEVIKDENS